MEPVNDEAPSFMMTGRVYDFVKRLVQIILPALSTLYFTLGAIWGLPAVEQVVGTLAAIATFLGVLIGLSARAYNNSGARYDGSMTVSTDHENERVSYVLELKDDPVALKDKDEVTFKVDPQ